MPMALEKKFQQHDQGTQPRRGKGSGPGEAALLSEELRLELDAIKEQAAEQAMARAKDANELRNRIKTDKESIGTRISQIEQNQKKINQKILNDIKAASK